MDRSYENIDDAVVLEIASVLMASNMTLATAESCTGGGIGASLTALAGSSQWFNGGVISYSNQVKETLLGVSLDLINTHGAVSNEVAMAMAIGGKEALQTDWCIAVTGIAGPAGGTVDKPVGTVWVAWAGPSALTVVSTNSRQFYIAGNREEVRDSAISKALQGFLHVIKGESLD